MMTLAGFALSYSGFTALCLSLDRHHRDLFQSSPDARRRLLLRSAGWLLLLLSLFAATGSGRSVDIVFWFGLTMATALSLVLLLTYAPRFSTGAAVLAVPVALLAWLAEGLH